MSKTLDSLLRKGFKTSKCKTLLKLTVSRIKLLRNKGQAVAKQTRRDVAQLLKNGQETSARNRVELVYREENTLAAYDLIEQYCELVVNRLPIISAQKLCPTDLKEAVSGLIYAAPRCADLHELQKVRNIFESKYGKDFVVAAAELRPDCGVSRQIIEKLSSRSPAGKVKLKLMKEIAAENKIEWDPKEALDELVKPPQELIAGPNRFPIASQVLTTNSGKDNSVSESVKAFLPTQVYSPPPAPTSSTSSSSSVSYNEEDGRLAKGKFPPPGKYDSLPRDASRFTEHVGSVPQGDVYHSSVSEEIPRADPYASAKAEGRMDYENIYDPHLRAKMDRWKQYEGSTGTQEETENLSLKSENITSSTRQKFEADASSTKGSNLEYQDVASAAQAAFESAAHAAAAARMVIDLTKRDPRNGSIGGSFKNEEELDNLKVFNNKKVSHAARNGVSSNSEEELDSFDVPHAKEATQFARYSARSESEEELDSLKVPITEKATQVARNGASSDSEEELDSLKVLNTKKAPQVARNGSGLVHSDNLETSSESAHEANDIWPFTEDPRSQHSSANLTRNSVDKSSDYDDEINQTSLPLWKHKDASSTSNFYETKPRKDYDDEINQASFPLWKHKDTSNTSIFYETKPRKDYDDEINQASFPFWKHKDTLNTSIFYETKPRKQSDSSTSMGPRFDENGSERDDDSSTFFSSRNESYSKFTENNSSFSKPEDQDRDKPISLVEGGFDSRDQLGYGQRRGSEAKASARHKSRGERDAHEQFGTPVLDSYLESDDLHEKRVPLRSYNKPEAVFVSGSRVGKFDQTDSSGTASTLNKSEGSTYRKLRWQPRSPEGAYSPLQSNERRYQEPDELVPSNSKFGYDVARHIDNESPNHVMQASTKWEDDGLLVSSPVKGKFYSGGSRRSVRSVRSQQSKEHIRNRNEYDFSSHEKSSSIVEDSRSLDDRKFNKANRSKVSPSRSHEDASVVDISQIDFRNGSAFSRSSSASLSSSSSLQPSPSSDPSNLAAPGIPSQTNHSHEGSVSPQAKSGMRLSKNDPSENILTAGLSKSWLPDDNEFTKRLEALRRKR